MPRGLGLLGAVAAMVLSATPATAQSPLRVGQTIVAVPGFSDAACLNQGDLDRYSSATEMCATGRQQECQVAKELESRGACGFHYGVYVVKSVDTSEGWIEISPDSDRSLSYWAQDRDFSPAQLTSTYPGERLAHTIKTSKGEMTVSSDRLIRHAERLFRWSPERREHAVAAARLKGKFPRTRDLAIVLTGAAYSQ